MRYMYAALLLLGAGALTALGNMPDDRSVQPVLMDAMTDEGLEMESEADDMARALKTTHKKMDVYKQHLHKLKTGNSDGKATQKLDKFKQNMSKKKAHIEAMEEEAVTLQARMSAVKHAHMNRAKATASQNIAELKKQKETIEGLVRSADKVPIAHA